MRSVREPKLRRPRNVQRRDGRSWRGGLTAFGAIAVGFVSAYLLAPEWIADHEIFAPVLGQAAGTPAAARAGSIFFASMNRDTCRMRSFDNVSGAQWDFGVVDCRDAILQFRQSPSMDRMNAITDAFRPK
jgi:hypothetical protein